MNLEGFTNYHAKYLAADILRDKPLNDVERLIGTLYDADVEIHPHQLASVNFAFNNPLSKGVILADEMGLGKTIEAALVMSWFISKGKKNFLVIAPTSEVAMWAITLMNRFHLKVEVVNDETFERHGTKTKVRKHFEGKKVFVTTYKVAHKYFEDFAKVEWDMVVVDEAHRMKNIYDLKSVIGESIVNIVGKHKAILITSNPFQSTMKRLFPLGSLVDDYIFGDRRSFNYQFVSITDDIDYKDLSSRLSHVMKRTMTSRAKGYIDRAKRVEIPIIYQGSPKEIDFIIAMINYYIGGNKYGIPSEKASLQALGLFVQMTLSPKIAMDGIQLIDDGLQLLLDTGDTDKVEEFVANGFQEDVEILEWVKEEWFEKKALVEIEVDINAAAKKVIAEERKDLLFLREFGLEVRQDSRFEALITGLARAEKRMKKYEVGDKIVIFTQSKQAQKYLAFLLQERGYKNIFSINKVNDDYRSDEIYESFIENSVFEHLRTGKELVDRRTAILKAFEEEGNILVATDLGVHDQVIHDVGAVVNYDLPIDPYLSEKRISKVNGHMNNNKVFVVNIVNEMNEFELWNYDIQNDEFDIFSGMYGRSDLAIGAIGVGTDFAMTIFGYYMRHHTINLVETAFRKIQIQINEATGRSMTGYYRKLAINSAKKDREEWKELMDKYQENVNKLKDSMLKIAGKILGEDGSVTSRGRGFVRIKKKPFRMKQEELGEYTLDELNMSGYEKLYMTKGIGKKIFQAALRLRLPVKELKFRYASVSPRLKSLKELKGKSGALTAHLVTITGLQKEEYIIFSAFTDEGDILNQDQCRDLFELKATVKDSYRFPNTVYSELRRVFKENKEFLLNELIERDSGYMREIGERIDKWIFDRVLVHKKDLRLIMTEKRKLHRRWINAPDGRKKDKLQSKLLEVGVFRRKKRRHIRRVQQGGQEEKELILAKLSKETQHKIRSKKLFTIRWELR